jgi:hypothetical protein
LGTDVPSNLGGLGGGTSYFKSRYQTPQTNSMMADLRATAQANALNTLMSNELAKAKKRYNDAYRAAKKRSGSGGKGGTTLSDLLKALGVKTTNNNNAGDPKDAEYSATMGDGWHDYLQKKADDYNNLNKKIQDEGLGNVVDMNDPEAVGDFIADYWYKYNESGYRNPFGD